MLMRETLTEKKFNSNPKFDLYTPAKAPASSSWVFLCIKTKGIIMNDIKTKVMIEGGGSTTEFKMNKDGGLTVEYFLNNGTHIKTDLNKQTTDFLISLLQSWGCE